MTRKDFILELINRIKLLLKIAVLVYFIYFLFQVVSDKNSNERAILFSAIIFIGILIILGMIYFFVDYLKSKIPEKVKIYLNIISKVIDIVCEIFAIIILMKLWKEDRIFEFILIVCIVLFSMYTNKKNKLK
ncbi:MAG: hypothetical protein ACJAYP_000686 [Flavobacterium sp.]|jgi:membrane protein DedA with SNARE-associated domain